jgi:hypothetical protein
VYNIQDSEKELISIQLPSHEHEGRILDLGGSGDCMLRCLIAANFMLERNDRNFRTKFCYDYLEEDLNTWLEQHHIFRILNLFKLNIIFEGAQDNNGTTYNYALFVPGFDASFIIVKCLSMAHYVLLIPDQDYSSDLIKLTNWCYKATLCIELKNNNDINNEAEYNILSEIDNEDDFLDKIVKEEALVLETNKYVDAELITKLLADCEEILETECSQDEDATFEVKEIETLMTQSRKGSTVTESVSDTQDSLQTYDEVSGEDIELITKDLSNLNINQDEKVNKYKNDSKNTNKARNELKKQYINNISDLIDKKIVNKKDDTDDSDSTETYSNTETDASDDQFKLQYKKWRKICKNKKENSEVCKIDDSDIDYNDLLKLWDEKLSLKDESKVINEKTSVKENESDSISDLDEESPVSRHEMEKLRKEYAANLFDWVEEAPEIPLEISEFSDIEEDEVDVSKNICITAILNKKEINWESVPSLRKNVVGLNFKQLNLPCLFHMFEELRTILASNIDAYLTGSMGEKSKYFLYGLVQFYKMRHDLYFMITCLCLDHLSELSFGVEFRFNEVFNFMKSERTPDDINLQYKIISECSVTNDLDKSKFQKGSINLRSKYKREIDEIENKLNDKYDFIPVCLCSTDWSSNIKDVQEFYLTKGIVLDIDKYNKLIKYWRTVTPQLNSLDGFGFLIHLKDNDDLGTVIESYKELCMIDIENTNNVVKGNEDAYSILRVNAGAYTVFMKEIENILYKLTYTQKTKLDIIYNGKTYYLQEESSGWHKDKWIRLIEEEKWTTLFKKIIANTNNYPHTLVNYGNCTIIKQKMDNEVDLFITNHQPTMAIPVKVDERYSKMNTLCFKWNKKETNFEKLFEDFDKLDVKGLFSNAKVDESMIKKALHVLDKGLQKEIDKIEIDQTKSIFTLPLIDTSEWEFTETNNFDFELMLQLFDGDQVITRAIETKRKNKVMYKYEIDPRLISEQNNIRRDYSNLVMDRYGKNKFPKISAIKELNDDDLVKIKNNEMRQISKKISGMIIKSKRIVREESVVKFANKKQLIDMAKMHDLTGWTDKTKKNVTRGLKRDLSFHTERFIENLTEYMNDESPVGELTLDDVMNLGADDERMNKLKDLMLIDHKVAHKEFRKKNISYISEFISRFNYNLLYLSQNGMTANEVAFNNLNLKGVFLIVKGGKKIWTNSITRMYRLAYPCPEIVTQNQLLFSDSVSFKYINNVRYLITGWNVLNEKVVTDMSFCLYKSMGQFVNSYVRLKQENQPTDKASFYLPFILMLNNRRTTEVLMADLRYPMISPIATHAATDLIMKSFVIIPIDPLQQFLLKNLSKNYLSFFRSFSKDIVNNFNQSTTINIFTNDKINTITEITNLLYATFLMTKAPYTQAIDQAKNLEKAIDAHFDYQLHTNNANTLEEVSIVNENTELDKIMENDFYYNTEYCFKLGVLSKDCFKSLNKVPDIHREWNTLINRPWTDIANESGLRTHVPPEVNLNMSEKENVRIDKMCNDKNAKIIQKIKNNLNIKGSESEKLITKKQRIDIKTELDKDMKLIEKMENTYKKGTVITKGVEKKVYLIPMEERDLYYKTKKRINENKSHLNDSFFGQKSHEVVSKEVIRELKKDDAFVKILMDLDGNEDLITEKVKKMYNINITFKERIRNMKNLKIVFHIVDKEQWKGGREIFVMTIDLKTVQKPLEDMFAYLSSQIENEIISVPSNKRLKLLHQTLFSKESMGMRDYKKFFFNFDCKRWGPRSMFSKYLYFIMGMSGILPTQFIDLFMAVCFQYFGKNVIVSSKAYNVFKNNLRNEKRLQFFTELEDLDSASYELPYSFVMGIFNYLSSLMHAVNQMDAIQKITSLVLKKYSVSILMVMKAHSDDSGGFVMLPDNISSVKQQEILCYVLKAYEFYLKMANHMLSVKKCIVSVHYFELLSILYINDKLAPLTPKFFPNMSFKPTLQGFASDMSQGYSKCIELISMGATLSEAFYNTRIYSEMVRRFYGIQAFSDRPIQAFGGIYSHPLLILILGSMAENARLMITDEEKYLYFDSTIKFLKGNEREIFNQQGFCVSYPIPQKKSLSYIKEEVESIFSSEYLAKDIFVDGNFRNSILYLVSFYNKLKDDSFAASLNYTSNTRRLTRLFHTKNMQRINTCIGPHSMKELIELFELLNFEFENVNANHNNVLETKYPNLLKVIDSIKKEKENNGARSIYYNLFSEIFSFYGYLTESEDLKVQTQYHPLTCKPTEIDLTLNENFISISGTLPQIWYSDHPDNYLLTPSKDFLNEKIVVLKKLKELNVDVSKMTYPDFSYFVNRLNKFYHKKIDIYSYVETENRIIRNHIEIIDFIETNSLYQRRFVKLFKNTVKRVKLGRFQSTLVEEKELRYFTLVKMLNYLDYTLTDSEKSQVFYVDDENKKIHLDKVLQGIKDKPYMAQRIYDDEKRLLKREKIENISCLISWTKYQAKTGSSWHGSGQVIIKLSNNFLEINLDANNISSINKEGEDELTAVDFIIIKNLMNKWSVNANSCSPDLKSDEIMFGSKNQNLVIDEEKKLDYTICNVNIVKPKWALIFSGDKYKLTTKPGCYVMKETLNNFYTYVNELDFDYHFTSDRFTTENLTISKKIQKDLLIKGVKGTETTLIDIFTKINATEFYKALVYNQLNDKMNIPVKIQDYCNKNKIGYNSILNMTSEEIYKSGIDPEILPDGILDKMYEFLNDRAERENLNEVFYLLQLEMAKPDDDRNFQDLMTITNPDTLYSMVIKNKMKVKEFLMNPTILATAYPEKCRNTVRVIIEFMMESLNKGFKNILINYFRDSFFDTLVINKGSIRQMYTELLVTSSLNHDSVSISCIFFRDVMDCIFNNESMFKLFSNVAENEEMLSLLPLSQDMLVYWKRIIEGFLYSPNFQPVMGSKIDFADIQEREKSLRKDETGLSFNTNGAIINNKMRNVLSMDSFYFVNRNKTIKLNMQHRKTTDLSNKYYGFCFADKLNYNKFLDDLILYEDGEMDEEDEKMPIFTDFEDDPFEGIKEERDFFTDSFNQLKELDEDYEIMDSLVETDFKIVPDDVFKKIKNMIKKHKGKFNEEKETKNEIVDMDKSSDKKDENDEINSTKNLKYIRNNKYKLSQINVPTYCIIGSVSLDSLILDSDGHFILFTDVYPLLSHLYSDKLKIYKDNIQDLKGNGFIITYGLSESVNFAFLRCNLIKNTETESFANWRFSVKTSYYDKKGLKPINYECFAKITDLVNIIQSNKYDEITAKEKIEEIKTNTLKYLNDSLDNYEKLTIHDKKILLNQVFQKSDDQDIDEMNKSLIVKINEEEKKFDQDYYLKVKKQKPEFIDYILNDMLQAPNFEHFMDSVVGRLNLDEVANNEQLKKLVNNNKEVKKKEKMNKVKKYLMKENMPFKPVDEKSVIYSEMHSIFGNQADKIMTKGFLLDEKSKSLALTTLLGLKSQILNCYGRKANSQLLFYNFLNRLIKDSTTVLESNLTQENKGVLDSIFYTLLKQIKVDVIEEVDDVIMYLAPTDTYDTGFMK